MIGSLFSGYGGLDMAAEALGFGPTAWHCEIEPAPARVLAHRWPGVPNLGDITAVDWTQVQPVDVITGGFPCQDISNAGKRAGIEGARSGLWSHYADAVRVLRPRLVLVENVGALLGRGMGRVLGDLAALGYDARWVSVRASDAGAPHGRQRIFIVAADASSEPWRIGDGDDVRARSREVERETTAGRGRAPADTRGEVVGLGAGLRASEHAGQRRGRPCDDAREDAPDADIEGRQGTEPAGRRDVPARCAAPHTEGDGRDEGRTEPARLERRPDAVVGGSAVADAPDADGGRREVGAQQHGAAAQDSADGGPRGRHPDGHSRPADVEWGPYAGAIRRWEHAIGRRAPRPTEPGSQGGERLSSRFVEWMMGLPAGWVCDVPGLTRNEQLKMLGNGVVPQQAILAFTALLTSEVAA
jgi:DNA (cytosine-5)-methyltransferase 1